MTSPFIWGIASAPYQTEDSPTDPQHPEYFQTDWDLFEKAGRLREGRGQATYSWTEIERDLAAIESLNVSHYRFGVEWARIEPQPGVYNEAALQKYVELARRLKARGITPIVCLWHFSFPSWLTDLKNPDRHGWFHPLMESHWKPYVSRVLKAFGSEVTLWMPQNEPNAYALCGYLLGFFPPGRYGGFQSFRHFMRKAADFYIQAADLIHAASPQHKCISVQNIVYYKKSWLDVGGIFWQLGLDYNFLHLDLVHRHSDIIGFNYYFQLTAALIPGPRTNNPEGLKWALDEIHRRYKKTMWITENGMQEPGDEKRPQYLRDHIDVTLEARRRGLPIEAYFAWCLIDNFEWSQGYREKFGLFRMDPTTRQITPKGSARLYAEIVKEHPSV